MTKERFELILAEEGIDQPKIVEQLWNSFLFWKDGLDPKIVDKVIRVSVKRLKREFPDIRYKKQR